MQGIDPTGRGGIPNKVCCHCASGPLSSPLPTPITQTHYAATAMAILKDFGFGSLAEGFLAKNGVHDLGNLLSLDHGIHLKFDKVNLWFDGAKEVGHLSTPLRYQPDVYADKQLLRLCFYSGT